MRRAIDETETDALALRRLLVAVAQACGTKAALADELGVDASTVSNYLAGKRGLGWHVVRGAMARVAALYPERVPALVKALAWNFCEARGHWVPEGLRSVGEFRDEAEEAGGAPVDLQRACKTKDRAKIAAAIANHQSESDDVVVAAAAALASAK